MVRHIWYEKHLSEKVGILEYLQSVHVSFRKIEDQYISLY